MRTTRRSSAARAFVVEVPLALGVVVPLVLVVVVPLALGACANEQPSFAARDAGAPAERSIATPDGALFTRSGGLGPDLVLLHGLGDSSVGWRKVEAPLRAAGYRVTVVDALGAGRSDKPPRGDYRLPAHVERLRRVLDALGIIRATIVGNSLGGSIALLFAEQHADRVDRLVLIDPAAFPAGGTTASWLWRSPSLAATALSMLPPATIARTALQLNFADAARITDVDVAAYAAEAARPGALQALAIQQRQLMPTREEIAAWTGAYRMITAPTLILWGAADRVLPREQGERLAAVMPSARLVVVHGVGHVLQLEDPARLVSDILAFVGR